MPSMVGQWAHIVGAEPTFLRSQTTPSTWRSGDDLEGEESEEETL